MRNPWMLRLFMLRRLPLALVAGVRIETLEDDRCGASVPYRWLSTNPFRSTYFAALSMAAEMSTGVLAMVQTESSGASVAMLLVDLEGSFGKKATARATFTCEQGAVLRAAVAETVATGEPAVAKVTTIGRMDDGTEVARFSFTWSFKRRSAKRAGR